MNPFRPSRLVTSVTPLRRALVAACLLVPSALTGTSAAECDLPLRPDGWSVARPAPFTEGGAVLTGFTMVPRAPDVMAVTNGAAVQVTADGGCAWTPAPLPPQDSLGVLSAERRVVEVEAAPAAAGLEVLWVLAQGEGTVERPLVYRSDSRGATFTGSGTGLPPVGEAKALAAGADGTTAYVVVDLPAVGRRLYVTTDGGARWGAAPAAEFPYTDLVVDTDEPEHVFAWSPDGVGESYDSGATFTRVEVPAPGSIRDVALSQAPRGSRLAVLAERGALLRSDNDGKDFTTLRVDPGADQVATAPDQDVAAVAGAGRVTLLPSVFRAVDVSTAGEEPLDVSLGLVDEDRLRVAGRADEAVLVHVGVALDLPGEVDGGVDLRAAQVVLPIGPRVVPETVDVTLKPGETRDLDYAFQVPASPSPIEVFFLIDTTGSMGFVINGVRDGLAKIVNDLTAAGIAARFGVAEVKDYPVRPYGGDDDLPYRLVRKVGPVDDELEQALESLDAGGGGDGPESMPTGYYQLATGAGDVLGGRTLVPPGDDAGFAEDVMRIVVASTDVPYHERRDGYPGPAIATAHEALAKERIRVIGISADRRADEDLERSATATRTFAPRHGVDCDRDGKAEVTEGAPLVCEITGGASLNIGAGGISVDTSGTAGVGTAILTLLRQLRDPAVLTLASSAPDVVRVLGDPAAQVDLKTPNDMAYRVRLSCPPARYGSTVRGTVSGLADGRTLATGDVVVHCQAPVVPPPRRAPVEEVVPPEPPRPVAAAAAAPPVPVQPVQQVNPNTNPQVNANPNPNAQLQAGAAQQRQEQIHLALAVDAHPGFDPEEELAMVRRDPPAALVPLAAAALATTAGTAFALRARGAPAAATARRRRPR